MAYKPIEEFINDLSDQSSRPIRDYPMDKARYQITLLPAQLDFSEIEEDEESYNQTVLITNSGFDKITITGLIVVGDFDLKSTAPTTIDVGETVSVEIAFTPTTIGNVTGGLYINANQVVGNRFVKLLGQGI